MLGEQGQAPLRLVKEHVRLKEAAERAPLRWIRRIDPSTRETGARLLEAFADDLRQWLERS